MHAPTLARWIGDPDTFFTSYWRRRPAIFRPAGGGRSPFGLEDVDAALASGFLREPYIEMANAEQPLEADSYTSTRTVNRSVHRGFADEAKIRALLDDGATLLLRCLDQWHRPTGAVLAGLAEELQRPVEAYFFVTPAGHQGLPLHRDDADVLVIQVAGRKEWHVHEGPADGRWGPGSVGGERPPAQVLRTTLGPGDVLYLPRGFAHQATGDEGLSAHLSLTIREIALLDLCRSLQSLSLEGLSLAPRPVDDKAIVSSAAEVLDHVRERLAGLDPDELVRRARQARLAAAPAPRPALSLTELAATQS